MTDKLCSILLEMKKRKTIKSGDDFKRTLNKIIEIEKKKPARKFDHEIIDECADKILEIDGVNISAVEERSRESALKILADIQKTENKKVNPTGKIIFKPALMALIIALSSFAVMTIAAYAAGYGNVIEMGKALFGFPEKTRITLNNGDEIIYSSDNRLYDSIDEMAVSEKLKIIYPGELPKGYIFQKVEVVDYGEYLDIAVCSNGNYIVFKVVTNHKNDSLNEYTDEINGIKYLISEIDGLYYAMYVADENHYSVTCIDREVLLEVLQTIK